MFFQFIIVTFSMLVTIKQHLFNDQLILRSYICREDK